MKTLFTMRTLLLAFLAISLVNCSKDPLTTSSDLAQEENYTTKNIETTEVSSVFVHEEVHSLFDVTPNQEFDNQSMGLYHGVISTNDLSLKGKIYISVGNDNIYAAEVELLNGKRIMFRAANTDVSSLHFYNERGSFDFNVEDFENPIAENVVIENKDAYIKAYKDNSYSRRMIGLGTFTTTDGGALITGNWDIVAGGCHTNSATCHLFLIADIIITINGVNYSDTDNNYENMGMGCYTQGYSSAAFHPNPFGGGPSLQGMNQISVFAGATTNWSARISEACNITQGTWSRNGRTGTFSLY